MSVGGKVIEVIDLPCRDRVWVNTFDRESECAIYVERNAKSRCISEGDGLWWQSRFAYWTPQCIKRPSTQGGKAGVDYDIQIPKIGYSGVSRPRADAVKGGNHDV